MNNHTKDLLFRLSSRANEPDYFVTVTDMCAEIPFENGYMKHEKDREAWGELAASGFILECNAGLHITPKGMLYIS